MTYMSDPHWGLPDPEMQPEFYADVPVKRLVAWVIDTVLIVLVSILLIPLTAFTAFFFFPFLVMLVGFFYRWWSLASRSATPGMRIVAIEIRNGRGEHLDTSTAALHTLAYSVAMTTVILQVASAVLMLTGPRAQGLHDLLLGTAAVNRAARV